jgi:putative salt-induced outer membrane protein
LNAVSDLNEGALSLSSNYSNQINETLAITNDTDIIGSESDTVVYNDLGFNVSMTETLALRTSLVTEYHTDPAPGKDDTDNALGVSLVYNFN